MTLLRSLLFNLFFYVWTSLILVVGLPLMLGPRSWLYHLGRFWVGGIMAALRILCGLRYEVRGLENLPDGPVLIAAKHQSAWDTLIFSLLLWDHSFVLKQELTWIPVFGLYLLRAGLVPVDRKGGSRALRKMVAKAKHAVSQGRPIVIFPEGTRVAPGQKRPYHPGVAALYSQLGIGVVPVALNSGLFWGRHRFAKKAGTIVLEFLPQIEPGLHRKEFLRRLETAIEERSRALASPNHQKMLMPQAGESTQQID
ncbi:1-acyl-sn-glycerol-3-phosphate acyltransferase [Pelagibius litoralis]|uniref:1-acyl-sn-glycerol-3-phosphate acyltransferase n=1 Tax=Pelagibius litoralis TaxID=374515 RepID=A0A967EX97_9PROT|nr:lysophospholipid acyltransferase family protein [Pelagibius litoralis]NIA68420.1 1-acyl-sn-glycerol-3-phosphate acyltransferase [Pelagibius litoralis]